MKRNLLLCLAIILCLCALSSGTAVADGYPCSWPGDVYVPAAATCCSCTQWAGEWSCNCGGGTYCGTCGSGTGWCCYDQQDVW